MVSSINLGSFTRVGDKTVGSGILSGLDTASLISSLVKAKSIPIDILNDKISLTNDKIAAYSEMSTLLTNLQSASKALRNPPGLGGSQEDAFAYRDVFVTSSSGVSGNSYVGVTAEPGAQVGKYSLQVGKLAQAQSDRSATFSSSTSSLGLGAGTFDIVVGGNHTTISLESGDTLADVASSINRASDETGVRATVVKVNDTDYRLVLDSQETGADHAFSFDFTANPSLQASFGFTVSRNAQDAEIDLNGLTIQRSSNTLSDVIEGVTFSLYQPTPDYQKSSATSLTVEVDESVSTAKDSIVAFTNAYNDFRMFVGRQQEKDDNGNYVKTALLHDDPTFQSITSQAASNLNKIISGLTAGNPQALADIGITFTDYSGDDENPAVSNILLVDETKLTNKLTSDFDGVKNVFQFNLTASSNKLRVYERSNTLSVNDFSVSINNTLDAGQRAKVTYTDSSGDHTLYMDYEATKDKASSYDITQTSILGASTAAQAFTATDGDRLHMTLTDQNGVVTQYDLTYDSTLTGSSKFKNLNELATAINQTVSGVTASISGNKLVVVPDDGNSTISFSNSDATNFKGALGLKDTSVIGGVLRGQSGTILDGFTLIYSGDGTDLMDVHVSQGVADQLFNTVNKAVASDGILQNATDALTSKNTTAQKDITRLNGQIDQFRNALILKYSKLESAVSAANSILQLLEAQQKAQSSG